MSKKIIGIIFMLVLLVLLTGCQSSNNKSITLNSLKEAISGAGYSATLNIPTNGFSNKDVIGEIVVAYTWKNDWVYANVFEMKNNTAATDYAKKVNADEDRVAVVNGKFLVFAEKGMDNFEFQETFLEGLINGNPIEKAELSNY